MATLADIRAKYPQYSDMSDDSLLDGLYKKHYSDMPRDQFEDKVRPIGIDFNQPVEAVRSAIGKLTGKQRERALSLWGDTFVANERKQAGPEYAVDNTVRTLARGTFVGPVLDEISAGVDAARNAVGLGGAPYEETLAYQRARDRAVDKSYPVASTVGKLAGGLAGGIGAARAAPGAIGAVVGGPLAFMRPANTMAGNMALGGGAGAAYGAVGGFGEGEGADDRLRKAGTGAGYGAAAGVALPPLVSGAANLAGRAYDAVSPQIARASAQFAQAVPARRPGNLSAAAPDGAAGYTPSPADAAADQIIANQLVRAGVPMQQLRDRLGQANEAARFHTSGRAQNALAPVDLDPSLQRLAGSVARQQPEAGNTARSFIYGRQTGITPDDGLAIPGLPTRPALAKPQDGDLPMGQFERVRDGLKRALRIQDHEFHGHAGSGFATEKAIIARARTEAADLYGKAYAASQNINIRPTIEPVLRQWEARLAEEPLAVANQIRGAMRQYMAEAGPVANLQRFDKAKQFLDGRISKFFESADSRNRYLGGVLTEFQRDMIAAVDKLPNAGPAYAAARDAFGSQMALRDALRLGRDVFRENAEVAIDQYRQLATKGEKKLFRLGLLESFNHHMGRQKRTADVTQAFQNPRIQQILEEVIERTGKDGKTFSDRPERFGRFIGNEQSMIRTRNEVLGNSKTAERLADDAALNNMQGIIEQMKQQPTLTALGIKALEGALNRLFGFRADTANAIANKLFNADPRVRAQILDNIGRRMGRDRMEQLNQALEAVHRPALQAGAITGGATAQGEGGAR